MLRINLLPAYVAQRRQTRMWRAVFTVAFIVIVVGLLGWNAYLVKQVGTETDLANQAVADKQAIDTQNSLAASTIAQIGPIKGDVDWANKVTQSNTELPDLYSRIARWTSPAIYYTDMVANGDTLDIKGYTKSIDDLGRYLQYMYTEPDVTSVSLTSALPNFNSALVQVPYYKGKPLDMGTQQPGQFGPRGGLGGPNGMPGQNFGRPGGLGGPPNFGGLPQAGVPGGMPNQQALMDPGLANALATGQGLTMGYRRVDSFTFEVQCTLKNAITPPGDPGSGASGAAGAAGGATVPGMGGA